MKYNLLMPKFAYGTDAHCWYNFYLHIPTLGQTSGPSHIVFSQSPISLGPLRWPRGRPPKGQRKHPERHEKTSKHPGFGYDKLNNVEDFNWQLLYPRHSMHVCVWLIFTYLGVVAGVHAGICIYIYT